MAMPSALQLRFFRPWVGVEQVLLHGLYASARHALPEIHQISAHGDEVGRFYSLPTWVALQSMRRLIDADDESICKLLRQLARG
jgi:hypothetical protein